MEKRRRMEQASTTTKALVAAVFAALLGGAWLIASAQLPPFILPSPSKVAEAAARFFTTPRQLGHLAATLMHIGVSIAIAFVLGAVLALLAHYSRLFSPTIHQRLSPFLNAFSGIGWTLLAVIWFGVSTPTVIFSIAVVLLPFAIVNLREGLVALDRELDEMSRSFGRGGWRLFRLVVVPALIPFAAATLRIMFGVAWKVALTAELFGGSQGLGYLINLARQEYDTELIFTVILFIIIAVYLADRLVFQPIERVTARQFGGQAVR
jgi:NitT/TauT family transport system permease protein/sulfonate transport system permease protein